MGSYRIFAQSVTITLVPGWNWISYPNSAVMSVNDALGAFTPMNGDKIKSQFSNSSYLNGYWRGGVTHFIPGWGYMYYSARTEVVEFVFANSETSEVVVTTLDPTDITATSAVVSSTVTIGEGNHIYARGVCWGTEPNPNIDGSHTTDSTIAGSLSDTLTELTSNTTYYVRAYVVTDYGLAYGNQLSFTTEVGGSGGDHDYVDLGLPSGLLWATCNVGADTPEDYGDHFAWGETQPKEYYNWSTYQHCMGSYSTMTKYCNNSEYGYNGYIDNLTILLPMDDAATANWGNGWRMPTREEWQELYQNTTCTWTTLNGVNGRLFFASNGSSLFLPAAGYRLDSSLYLAGSYGYYWSSSLHAAYPSRAWILMFRSLDFFMSSNGRPYGQSVRPVRSASQN